MIQSMQSVEVPTALPFPADRPFVLLATDPLRAVCVCAGAPFDMPCPPGYSCATPLNISICPDGYYCRLGSIEPRACYPLSLCPAGTSAPTENFAGGTHRPPLRPLLLLLLLPCLFTPLTCVWSVLCLCCAVVCSCGRCGGVCGGDGRPDICELYEAPSARAAATRKGRASRGHSQANESLYGGPRTSAHACTRLHTRSCWPVAVCVQTND
jgi:hypothetical protein